MRENKGFLSGLWQILYPSFTYLGISYLVSFLFSFVASARTMAALLQNGQEIVLQEMLEETMVYYSSMLYEMTFVSALLTLPVLALYRRKDLRKEKEQGTLHIYEPVAAGHYMAAFMLGCVSCLLLNNLISYSGLMELLYEGYADVEEVLFQGNFLIELAATGILIPIVEELLFRGLVQNRMKRYGSSVMAIFMSSLFFASFHGNMLQGIYSFILGLLLAYFYERYHSLLAPILIHCGANLMSVLATETSVLDFFYESEGIFLIFTVALAGLFLLCFYLMYTYVYPREITTQTDAESPEQQA